MKLEKEMGVSQSTSHLNYEQFLTWLKNEIRAEEVKQGKQIADFYDNNGIHEDDIDRMLGNTYEWKLGSLIPDDIKRINDILNKAMPGKVTLIRRNDGKGKDG